MSKRLFRLLLLLAGTITLCSCRCFPALPPSPEADTPLSMLYFSESNSYFKRVQGYEYRNENGAPAAYFYMANEEDLYPVPVDQAWVDTLSGFIRQYGMMSWDGFRGSADGMLDGTQFSIDFTFADGTTVSASGYGKFPANYGDASSAIDAHFMQLLPEDMRDW